MQSFKSFAKVMIILILNKQKTYISIRRTGNWWTVIYTRVCFSRISSRIFL